jgi:hypothetical protein
MIVDCSDCKVRDIACADCVVTVLLGPPGFPSDKAVSVRSNPSKIDIDQEELGAMGVLADSGLVPRLRLIVDSPDEESGPSLSSRDRRSGKRAG